jgi:hypothetical protein
MHYDARVAALALTVMLTAVPARSQTASIEAAKCRAGAQVIAKSIGGTVGNQTHALVAIMYAYAPEVANISYHCGPMSPTPSLTVTWGVSQRPSAATVKVITEADAAFTGAATGTVRKKLVVCIDEALKDQRDDTDGMAQVAMDGTSMMMQCQIFAGLSGGIVNVYPTPKR